MYRTTSPLIVMLRMEHDLESFRIKIIQLQEDGLITPEAATILESHRRGLQRHLATLMESDT